MSAPANSVSPDERVAVFDRVLVEIDETPESLVAAAQARCLGGHDCYFELLAVVERATASQAGAAAIFVADALENATAAALEHATSLLEPSATRVVVGRSRESLLSEARSTGATLVAVGMHPHRRLTARVFGTLDLAVLHDAPCSVLIARPGWGTSKPKQIVLGVDGSEASALAACAAESLATRLGIELRRVIALGGKPLDESVFQREHADALVDSRDPVTALAAAAGECDLLVVGDRGAHRRRVAGGSVGERLVYAARGSVLVVRSSQS
jgi:nucleotide-binding universal stress UspA family protein